MLRRILAPALVLSVLGAAVAVRAAAAINDPAADPTPQQLAAQLERDDQDVQATALLSQQIAQSQPQGLVLQLDKPIRQAAADRSFRASVRAEQTDIYLLAGAPATEHQVEAFLPWPLGGQVRDTAGALRAIWRLAAVTDITGIHPHFVRDFGASLPIPNLIDLYSGAAAPYRMDWTYLAAINYVETDFGRVLGPSVTGAEGPMQFEPGTWAAYGSGSVMNPRDAIAAAARYLNANGAPKDMADAIYAYNPTWDYVEAVTRYAQVIRRDQSWYTRLYYWSTAEPG